MLCKRYVDASFIFYGSRLPYIVSPIFNILKSSICLFGFFLSFFISLLLSFFSCFSAISSDSLDHTNRSVFILHTLQQFKLSQNFASSPSSNLYFIFPQISLLHVKSIYSFLTYFFGRSESFAFVTPRIHLVSFLQTLRFCLTRFISLILSRPSRFSFLLDSTLIYSSSDAFIWDVIQCPLHVFFFYSLLNSLRNYSNSSLYTFEQVGTKAQLLSHISSNSKFRAFNHTVYCYFSSSYLLSISCCQYEGFFLAFRNLAFLQLSMVIFLTLALIDHLLLYLNSHKIFLLIIFL